jgi:copper transport protein
MTLGYALVTALVFLAWLADRVWLLWSALVVGLGFASGLSLSGHSAVDSGASWKSQLADWVHLSAAMVWIGGLVQLGLVVWPLAPELRRRAFLGFSRLATLLIGALLLAGVYLAILRMPTVSDLWETGYGHVLLVKIGLVALALGWGAAHKFLAAPRVSAASGRLRRSLLGESMVGMAVLLAAAVLVDSQPPARPPAQTPRAESR